jgi:hypothetical protein
MKSLWFVEAFVIGAVLLVVGYVTLPEMGFAGTVFQ